jgi:hypothetical protein
VSNRHKPLHRSDEVAPLNLIDTAILDLIESCCRKLQVLTGRTNVWLAVQLTNLSIVVYFVWAGTFFVISDRPTRVLVAVFCVGLLYLLTQTVFRVSIEAAENSAYRRVAKGYRNPRRVRDAMLRMLFLILSILLLGPVLLVYASLGLRLAVLTYSLIVLTTVLLYVVACDPLPPCAGKLKEWLTEGRTTVRSAERATGRVVTSRSPHVPRLR